MLQTRVLAFFLVSIALFSTGCASTSTMRREAAQELLEARPQQQQLETDFIVQSRDHCGPATLTMSLKRQDPQVSLEAVTDMSFTPGAEGAYQTDMLSASRRLGFAPYAVKDFKAMIHAIQTGETVVVFQNLGFKSFPVWHYALLIGYDAPSESLILHTGDTPAQPVKLAEFLKAWDRGDRWSYVMLRPDRLPDFATMAEALENAEVFSSLGLREAAMKTYASVGLRWPSRYEAPAGLALEYAAEGETKQAIRSLQQAIDKNPEHAGLYFNLAYLYRMESEERLYEEAKKMSLTKAAPEAREEMLRRYEDF